MEGGEGKERPIMSSGWIAVLLEASPPRSPGWIHQCGSVLRSSPRERLPPQNTLSSKYPREPVLFLPAFYRRNVLELCDLCKDRGRKLDPEKTHSVPTQEPYP